MLVEAEELAFAAVPGAVVGRSWMVVVSRFAADFGGAVAGIDCLACMPSAVGYQCRAMNLGSVAAVVDGGLV